MIIKKNRLDRIKEYIFIGRKYITIFVLAICIIFFLNNLNFIENLKNLNLLNTFHLIFIFLIFIFFESVLFKKILAPYINLSFFLSFSLTIVSYFLNLILPFSGLGFRYMFLKNNYKFSFENMIFVTSFIYIINFLNLFLILSFLYIFFSNNNFVINYKEVILYIMFILFFIILITIAIISHRKFQILKIYKKIKILDIFFVSLFMYVIFIFFIFSIINIIDPNFNNIIISSLVAIFIDLALVIQVLPFGIGSIELIFFNLLSNYEFDQFKILSIISLFRIIIHSSTFLIGAVLFYKYFKLSLEKLKNE